MRRALPAPPQEHVQNCRSSAQCAVASLLDPSTPAYNYLPYFYSRIFNLSWQVQTPYFLAQFLYPSLQSFARSCSQLRVYVRSCQDCEHGLAGLIT